MSAIPTRFILIDTSHAGNVGGAARALKVMGFDDLVLVNPRWPNVLRKEETIARASGATDVLAKARVVGSLTEALDGVSHLCATAMTERDFGPPSTQPRPHFEQLAKQWLAPALTSMTDTATIDPSPRPAGIAFLFGCERFGMSNEDIYRCHVSLKIPTRADFGSLNLASAVQLIAYEWRQALGGFPDQAPINATANSSAPTVADAQAIAGLIEHFQAALVAVEYLDPAAPKKLLPRLNQLLNRAQIAPQEVHLLRGIAKAMLVQVERLAEHPK